MFDKSPPKYDIGVALFLIVVSAAVLREAAGLPPGHFEPLGAAPIPRALAWCVIVLSGLVMVQAVLRMRRGDTGTPQEDAYVPRPLDAVAVLALTIGYVIVLSNALVNFAIATILFLVIAIPLLYRFRWIAFPLSLGIGVVMGFGLQYLFTRVFVVDLP